jgi:protein gp37
MTMGEITEISWTDHTFNPWIGCQRVSPACEHCYAESGNKRWGKELWGPKAERSVTRLDNWKKPVRWNKKAEEAGVRRLVFCASQADVFEDRRDLDEPRARLFELIEKTAGLDWLLLTKRADKMTELAPVSWAKAWPRNVWAGVTVEDQKRADERIPHLLNVPAVLRFLSCEPLLGPVNLAPWLVPPRPDFGHGPGGGSFLEEQLQGQWDAEHKGRPTIDWVICGGESQYGARPMRIDWARDLRDLCAVAGIPYHFKQWGEHDATGKRVGKPAAGYLLDGVEHRAFPEVSR